MKFVVRISETAVSDLLDIRNWIEEQADQEVAIAFVHRIQETISKFSYFLNRGHFFPKVSKYSRVLSFERRYVILNRVEKKTARIDRIVSGKRDLDNLN
jgi:plasmid stabilization system protein ParE